MPTVSLCMIVKDEAQWLPAALASVKELVDEIIVVDTGSTDATKEIAQQAGAKVFDFLWQNDFSAARNFSLAKATKDWILVLDADETLALKDYPRFRELLIWKIKEHPRIAGFRFVQRNYTNDPHIAEFVPCEPQEGYVECTGFAGYVPATPVRLFRRGFQYQFPVHEAVEPAILSAKLPIVDSGIPIHHFRERKGAVVAEAKSKKYGEIIADRAKAAPGEAKSFYELGLTQKAEGKLDEALLSFKTAIALDPRYRSPYSNIAEIYVMQGMVADAMAMLHKAIAEKPVPADYYNLGVLLMKQKQYEEAESSFKDAIRTAPNRIEFYTTLAALYAVKKEFTKALKVFDICIQHNPSRFEPYNLLGMLFFKLGKFADAVKVLDKGRATAEAQQATDHPDYRKLLINLAESYVKLGENAKAKAAFEQLAKLQPEQKEIMEKRIAELGVQ